MGNPFWQTLSWGSSFGKLRCLGIPRHLREPSAELRQAAQENVSQHDAASAELHHGDAAASAGWEELMRRFFRGRMGEGLFGGLGLGGLGGMLEVNCLDNTPIP